MRLLQNAIIASAIALLSSPSIAVPLEGLAPLAKLHPEISNEHSTPLPPDLAVNKYFHEPGTDDVYGHYDTRFFHGPVTYAERTETLRHMMRAYLLFFREKGLDTWIAHGTLLGWWWNGRMLPWDWDVDTQVSGETLIYMADHLNMTRHTYADSASSTSDLESGAYTKKEREYLLDVNPWSRHRDHGDGMNIIDARWIDTTNGLYIDITGLSELQPNEEPGVWKCKNDHAYRTTDLYPMRESVYEGVPAKIPYAYDRILIEEYQAKALTTKEYEGHVWNEQQRLWVKKPEPTKEHEKEPQSSKRKR